MTKPDLQNDFIPQNYDELYRYYILGDGRGNSLVQKLMRSMLKHSTEDERETLAQDIMVRIIDKKLLEVFDPTKANFGGLVFFVTRTVVCNHLSRKSRNPLTGLKGGSLVQSDPEDGQFEPGMWSLDRLFAPDEVDVGSQIDAARLVKRLVTWADRLAANPAHLRDASLRKLLGLLMEGHDARECGEKLGVTPSTVHNWLNVLRVKTTELQAA